MKNFLIALSISSTLAGLAGCSDYKLENRPTMIFAGRGGDKHHISPYPMSERSAAMWKTGACWRECSSKCAVEFNACGREQGVEACRPNLDRCDRICVHECRNDGGPLLYSFE